MASELCHPYSGGTAPDLHGIPYWALLGTIGIDNNKKKDPTLVEVGLTFKNDFDTIS